MLKFYSFFVQPDAMAALLYLRKQKLYAKKPKNTMTELKVFPAFNYFKYLISPLNPPRAEALGYLKYSYEHSCSGEGSRDVNPDDNTVERAHSLNLLCPYYSASITCASPRTISSSVSLRPLLRHDRLEETHPASLLVLYCLFRQKTTAPADRPRR